MAFNKLRIEVDLEAHLVLLHLKYIYIYIYIYSELRHGAGYTANIRNLVLDAHIA